jgi:glutathione S-transferase
LIEKLPAVSTWHERCHARHAYKKAFADQVAVFKEHAPPG